MRKLNNKVALITGCGRGFGESFATLFAREGAAVSICDIIPLKKLKEKVGSNIESYGGKVLYFQTDVSKEEQVNKMVRTTIEEFGTIDILVNNVGIAGPTKDCKDITFEEWEKTISVNLGGTFLYSKAVLPEMIRKKYGRIINLSSVAGKIPLPHRTPYVTSKMGVIGFTRSLASEVGRYGITVNAICPGLPGGERNLELAREMAKYLNESFNVGNYRKQIEEQRHKGVLAGRYLNREGEVGALISHDDVAQLALFLISDNASKITGQDINVSAGSVMW
jgi:NAD(P)-dependent dehydrogenase (short-subunit alcohol dehydrogenase family)